MRKFSKRTMIVAASAATALTVGSIAYAYYLTGVQGTGTGSATPAANDSLQVSWSGTAITGLVPGGSAINQTITFTNPNSYSVNYPAKSIAISSVSGPANCATNAVALLSGSATLPAGVLAGNGTTTVNVPISMADSTTVDQTACAGAPLTINYAVG